MHLQSLLHQQVLLQPASPVILAPGRPALSYGGLWRQIERIADVIMEANRTRPMRVAMMLPNGPEAAVTFLAVTVGATCVPLDPSLHRADLKFHLEDTDTRVIIVNKDENGPIHDVARELDLTIIEIAVDHSLPAGIFEISTLPQIQDARPRQADPRDVALILHTSGTTSRPKLVPLTHANLSASATNIARTLALSPADRCLNVMPLFHIHGLVGALLASIAGGGSIICTGGFNTRSFFHWVDEFRPTWYTAVPTIHQAVIELARSHGERPQSHRLRFIRSSSAPLSPVTLKALESAMEAPVIESYGMTEASHQMASNRLPPGIRKPGSVGVPAGAEIVIMNDVGSILSHGAVGEIVIRGPGVMAGYGGADDVNATAFIDEWFRTGDLGRFDEDGYLHVAGRLKEIVNRGGEKISPRELDDALLEHPDVAEVVAFGVPHPSLGEDLMAAVVRKSGSVIDERALRRFLLEKLSGPKVPSSIIFVDTIPKGATGKIQRNRLHERLADARIRKFEPPSNHLEHSLESIYREILHCGPVGIRDNFFALGGDSLMGARVVAAINRAHEVNLAAPTLFHYPTIAELSLVIEEAKAENLAHTRELMCEIEALSDEEVTRLLADEEAAIAERSGR
ncbi:MAG: AMP-binding protein [Burkholderiales bacterium]